MIALDDLGTPDERRQAMNEVARTLNAAEFEMTCRGMAARAGALVSSDVSEDERDADKSAQPQTIRLCVDLKATPNNDRFEAGLGEARNGAFEANEFPLSRPGDGPNSNRRWRSKEASVFITE
jgi:hypothetical protein